MKLAIHERKGSFSDRWIEFCQDRRIPYLAVDIFSDALFDTLRAEDVTALLAHPRMGDRRSTLAAHAIIQSVAISGLCEVFPSPADFWHFDNKIAQKYLFDALNIPTPRTHVFLRREKALEWAEQAEFPWVFKLKAGAGSVNVSLVRNKREATRKINRMFGRGYSPHAGANQDIVNKFAKHNRNRDWKAVFERIPNTFKNQLRKVRELQNERGYAYFQEFIPDNDHDTRVTIIGDRAFAFRRMTRPDDFRASGSGSIDHAAEKIESAYIKLAFDAANRLGANCVAFDFLRDRQSRQPLIVEMSYAFSANAVFQCSGHWRSDLTWQEGQMWPQDAILDDVLQKVRIT
ncbi:ATP-grasp domain-containing protein [Salinisphaera orenii]|uniref:ATP-grasp domain-containing protein n=1 Tax=Salinisphaera orenii TaxID=856731 RepID=UPI000F4C50D9|nr:hypothetical protein [Salinisphaera orenii]